MNEFKYALRRFAQGRHLNTVKIISLGLGFAISFILLSKVAHELGYDHFISDYPNVYRVTTYSAISNEAPISYKGISGAVAPGMMREISQVEVATRYTGVTDGSVLYTKENSPIDYQEDAVVDEYFFDVLTTEMLEGDPHHILKQKGYCMVNDELASKLGGNVIGQQIRFRSHPDVTLTIGGIYRKFPSNSSYAMDVLISMPSIDLFTWDGSNNWIGNDRYRGLVRLQEGTNPSDIKDAIRAMQQKYQDIEKIEKEYNAYFTYQLEPVIDLHLSDNVVRTSLLLIAIIGIIILVIALLNYLLLRITTIINSSKNTGIRKCLGAETRDVLRGILADTILHLVCALVVGAFFAFIIYRWFGDLLEISSKTLLSPYSLLIGIVVLLLSGILISIGSGRIVARQSLIETINHHQKGRRRWKLALLFIEGMGVTILLSSLFFVRKQYNHTLNVEKGFNVEHVYEVATSALDSVSLRNAVDRLRSLPEVELASLAFTSPLQNWQSGDNLFDPTTQKEIRNVTDYFWVDEYYLSLFKIPIVEGVGFDTAPCHSKHAMVNELFAAQLVQDFGWTDGVVGKEINITSHSNPMTIIGVFANFRSSRHDKPMRKDQSIVLAGGAFYRFSEILLLRLRNSEPETIKKVEDTLNEYSRFGDVRLESGEKAVREMYNNIQNLGYYAIFGSIIALLIALIGIIGYTEEEVTQRRKEIAIRKVNGATFGDIIRLFILRYLKIGIPATILGLSLSFIAIKKWVQTLEDQITLSPLSFFIIGLGVLVVTCLIMAIYCYYTANQNPTRYLFEE